MKYEFPIITHINDVLPAIKGRDEFSVNQHSFGTVILYHYVLEDSFDEPIRPECRGIVFDHFGKLISRPFHKFFNHYQEVQQILSNVYMT